LRNPLGSKVLVAGVAGIVLGHAAEALINHLAGATVVTDGMTWGAVLGIFLVSIPSFTRMGSLTVKSDKPAVNLIVGVGMFVLMFAMIVAVFFGVFWVISSFIS